MAEAEYVYVDSEQLIYEVEKRPLLYDVSNADYNDRAKKTKCWEDVCETIFANWSELTYAEKYNRGRHGIISYCAYVVIECGRDHRCLFGAVVRRNARERVGDSCIP